MGKNRLKVDSAGTSDWHLGNLPYRPAIEAAAQRGYDLTALRARQITARDFRDFDLILAMDLSNLHDVEALRPNGSATRVGLFLDAAHRTDIREVPDPYYTRDFGGVLDLIEQASQRIVDDLTG
jgi:protein-tyrosine phosphatase